MAEVSKERAILELAKAGSRPSEIAAHERVQLSEQEVVDGLRAVLEAKHPGVDPTLALELERIDQLHRAGWLKALQGDAGSLAQASNLSRLRRTLRREAAASLPNTPAQRLKAQLTGLAEKVCNDYPAVDDTQGGSTTPTREDHTDG